jgi:hypothetical protein
VAKLCQYVHSFFSLLRRNEQVCEYLACMLITHRPTQAVGITGDDAHVLLCNCDVIYKWCVRCV